MSSSSKNRTPELVEAMGGAKETATWAGVDRAWIAEWSKKRGPGIPTGWHYRLDQALGARGFEVDPGVFA